MSRTPGRKPAPTHLKLIRGDRKSRINTAEAVVATSAMPEAPEHLTAEAKKEWDRICPVLYNAGLLTRIDRGILGAYCQAFGRWEVAEMALARWRAEAEQQGDQFFGMMMITEKGNRVQNPLIGTSNKAMLDMSRYAADLGMTPSSRSRVVATPPGSGKEDPADRYF